jgi:excisionase family DNA binding protein
MKRSDGLPIYLTADEAADLLRTTRKAIYVMIERRQLPGVKRIGKRVLVRTETLVHWIDQQEGASLLQKDGQQWASG